MPLVETGLAASYCRTTSCVEDPQATALDALKAGDLRLLADLLSEEEGAVEADKQYPTESFKTLLHLAVEDGKTEAVRILLAGGARPEHYNTALKMTALHVAAMKGNNSVLELLLSYSRAGLELKDRAGRTALHQAVSLAHQDCVRTLCERAADLNTADNKGGQTPLSLAANAGNYELVKLLLSYGAALHDNDEAVIRNKFSSSQVEKLDLENAKSLDPHQVSQTLYNMVDKAELDGEEEEKFRSIVWRAKAGDLAKDNGRQTLVQACADRGLAGYVSVLLSAGCDPNTFTVTRPVPPLLLACASASPAVVKVMLEHNRVNINNNNSVRVDLSVTDQQFNQTVLHQILRKPKLNLQITEKSGDYETCLDLILNSNMVDLSSVINKQDSLGNTALHYATQFWDQETVTKLLLLGANIGLRNNLGEAPIYNILPSTMESFLNDHCIKSEGNPTNEDFKVSLHYDFLAPPRENESHVKFAFSGDGRDNKESPPPETDVLWYMARSRDHRHLLKHPVITSFLAMKWSRISVHYNSNMIFFALLVTMLTLYIFTNYAGESLGVAAPACPGPTWGHSLALWWTVAVLLTFLLLRELLQFSVHPTQYLTSFENILEIVLIVLTSCLLLLGHPGCNLEFKREISSAALLISWVLLVTMIGRHPQMSACNIYSTMFYRVLKTFISFLAWYSLFIIAFAFSFYILLHEDNGESDKEYPFFDAVGLTLVKTFSMFVGELEFSDIPFNSAFSYVFFLLFVFLIVVVLMNLLNGLAVSDTGLIREEAEIHAHVSRVEVIAQVEATLLGDPAHLLRGRGWLARLIPTCGLRRKIGSVLQCRNVFRTVTASKGILLFYSHLPDKRLTVYPNKKNMICSPCLNSGEIGREIVKSAKDLVLRLSATQQEESDLQERIRSIQIKQDKLELKIDSVISTLENLCKNFGNTI